MIFFKKIFNFVKILRRDFFLSSEQQRFIGHCRSLWGKGVDENLENEILIEIFPISSSLVSFSYMANVLAEKNDAKIIGYHLRKKNLRSYLLTRGVVKIFRSFRTGNFLFIKGTKDVRSSEKEDLFNNIKGRLKTKRDVENLEIDGILLGDLLYDSHLMNFKEATIDMKGLTFKESLKDLIDIYLYWKNYLSTHNVKAVVLSHCVYVQHATILRIAVSRGIPVYQVNWSSIDYLTPSYLHAYGKTQDYPTNFKKLEKGIQEAGILKAKERIDLRFSGEVGVDMNYSTKSAFAQSKTPLKRVLSESSKLKVFVATHCFFDSPHAYGHNLFPDFYEWLDFLGRISEKTDYEWYLKTHRDYLPGTMPILQELVQKYPKLTIISPETSHHQIIHEGIDFALTVYGTVGFEYAALGVPVVNASNCGPHSAFNFNINPRTFEDYESVLMSLEDVDLNINKEDVLLFYFMHNLYNTFNWLYEKTQDMFAKGNGDFVIHDKYYDYFLKEYSPERHKRIVETINVFLESNENYLTVSHLR